jgi:hypothetical protein
MYVPVDALPSFTVMASERRGQPKTRPTHTLRDTATPTYIQQKQPTIQSLSKKLQYLCKNLKAELTGYTINKQT